MSYAKPTHPRPGRTRAPALTLILVVGATLAAHAAVPGQVNYQGLLLDDQGQPVNGTADFVFSLFPVDAGGTASWTETHDDVPVLDGVYDVVLGETTPLTPELVDSGAVWLEIQVDGETLAPRQRLLAVPFALRARDAENVGGLSSIFVTELFEHFNADGAFPPNDDPREGLVDSDGDGIANFIDPDNDNDGVSDQDEASQGTDMNLVTPTVTGVAPGSVEASVTSNVQVTGTFFEPGMSATVGSQSPVPMNVTPTSLEVDVGPQTEGTKTVLVTRLNGESASGSLDMVEFQPVINAFDPPTAVSGSTLTVEIQGSGFLPGISVAFGSENPIPTVLSSTRLEVDVGPLPPGFLPVTVSYPSGKQDSANFESIDAATTLAVFTTSLTYPGDLGGIVGADAACAARATAGGLPGTFLAWLSDGVSAPATRFTTSGTFVRSDGAVIAESLTDLFDGSIDAPINRDEFAAPVVDVSNVWSGVASDGTVAAGDNCTGFTSQAGSGQVGQHDATDFRWTDTSFLRSCGAPQHLYCFEQ